MPLLTARYASGRVDWGLWGVLTKVVYNPVNASCFGNLNDLRKVLNRRMYQRKWRKDNPEKLIAQRERFHQRHPGHNTISGRRYSLKVLYGLSEQQFLKMLTDQNNCCALCGKPFTPKHSPHVDHNHETDEVRALLHSPCNIFLGYLEKNPELTTLGLAYLEKYNVKQEQRRTTDSQ